MAKVSRKTLREKIKNDYTEILMSFFNEKGEEVLQTKKNEFCFPVVDSEGNEDFVKITVAIPTGSREDNSPFDGYGEANSYQLKLKTQEEKAKAAAKKKAEKIKRDEEDRKKKAEQKAQAKKAKGD